MEGCQHLLVPLLQFSESLWRELGWDVGVLQQRCAEASRRNHRRGGTDECAASSLLEAVRDDITVHYLH